jgi:hypothetical protein
MNWEDIYTNYGPSYLEWMEANKDRKPELVYNYVFHFNPMTGFWCAIPRDSYLEYWSNSNDKKFMKSKDIKTLIELIYKGEKFIKTIKK